MGALRAQLEMTQAQLAAAEAALERVSKELLIM